VGVQILPRKVMGAAAAGFEKGIDHDFEPILSMTPLN
jgi:hypothetical protein